jgi:hypothetical protein
MKTKVIIFIGTLFMMLQFSTVFLFNQMLSLSEEHKIPISEIQHYQSLIMKTIIGSLIGFGILFSLLIVSLIIRSWRSGGSLVAEEIG